MIAAVLVPFGKVKTMYACNRELAHANSQNNNRRNDEIECKNTLAIQMCCHNGKISYTTVP